MNRKIVTVTHEAGGIRMNMDGVVVAHWLNAVELAESHAQLLVTGNEQQMQLTSIRNLVNGAAKGNDEESTLLLKSLIAEIRSLIAEIRKVLDEGVPF